MKWDDSKLLKNHQSKYVIKWQFIDFIPQASLKKREGKISSCTLNAVWGPVWDILVKLWLINSIK